MAFVNPDRRQRWALLITVTWTTAAVVLAVASQKIATFGFLGLLPVFLFLFRRQKVAADQRTGLHRGGGRKSWEVVP